MYQEGYKPPCFGSCQEIFQSLLSNGFSQERLLAFSRNNEAIREALVWTLLDTDQRAEKIRLEQHLQEGVLTAPFKPVPFTRSEWLKYFTKKAQTSQDNWTVDPRILEANSFDQVIQNQQANLLLIPRTDEREDFFGVARRVELLAPGFFASTKPSLLFELARLLGTMVDALGARYIFVGSKVAEHGASYPILLNPIKGKRTLGMTASLPPTSIPGYFAFCGIFPPTTPPIVKV